jgi:hypothetical protein
MQKLHLGIQQTALEVGKLGIRAIALSVLGGVGLAILGFNSMAIARPILEDTTTPGQNNTFSDRQSLEPGVTHVIGNLGFLADPEDYDHREMRMLQGDRADRITLPNWTPGEPFYAWIDNSPSGIDTVMGVLDADGNVLILDDDDSPLGTGLASAVSGRVNPDGTIVLGISGFPDFDFDGQVTPSENIWDSQPSSFFTPHEGDYTLYIQFNTEDLDTIDVDAADYGFPGRIEVGLVDEFILRDLEPFTPFVAWIDNSDSDIDTVMGLFSPEGDLLLLDDDGSPVGTGVASAIASTIGPEGALILKVSLFPDFNFTGEYSEANPWDDPFPWDEGQPLAPQPHGAEGEYELFVKVGIERLLGDVDFYTYTGLEPSQPFVAEVLLENFYSRLGWFDDQGILIQLAEYQDETNPRPQIVGTVPENGEVTLAVTGFRDEEFTGHHAMQGDYVLRLTVDAAP